MADLEKGLATSQDEIRAMDPAWCLETVKHLEIATSEDFEYASQLARGARTNWKRLDERRQTITKPILASKRGVDALFKPALDALAEIQRILEGKIGTYVSVQRAAATEAMTRTAETFAAGGTPTEPIPEVPHAAGIRVSEVWDFEVINPAEVPREYCSPDPVLIRAAIWYADTPRTAPRPIPGVAFKLWVDTTVTAERRTKDE